MERAKGVFFHVMILVGIIATINFLYNTSATWHIRRSDNPLSRLERELARCNLLSDPDTRAQCLYETWEERKGKKDSYLVDCSISQIGNYRIVDSRDETYAEFPSWYDVPLWFFFSENCLEPPRE